MKIKFADAYLKKKKVYSIATEIIFFLYFFRL